MCDATIDSITRLGFLFVVLPTLYVGLWALARLVVNRLPRKIID